MMDRGKQNLLGVYVDAVDYESSVEKIISAAQNRQSFAVSALAVHGVMTGVQDNEHAARLNSFDLIVPDGQPVRWALNILYKTQLLDRVYGPTLTLKVCERAAVEGLPIYLYGSKPEVLDRLYRNLAQRFPSLQIVGAEASRFRQISTAEKVEIINRVNTSRAQILLVGLGCPRQEVWVYEHKGLILMPMLAVGAAFDFHAGVLAQAPPILQRFGLEWIYRLSREPSRLWKRYVILNPLYLILVAQQILGIKKFIPPVGAPPQDSLRYG